MSKLHSDERAFAESARGTASRVLPPFSSISKREQGREYICPAELRSCVRSLGGDLWSKEVEMAVQLLDLDGDGMLGFEDFESLVESGGEAFRMYKMDGSRCITASSLKRMLSQLGETRSIEDCRDMIVVFDINNNGMLSFKEFRVMMR